MKRALRVWEINGVLLGNGVSFSDMDKLFAAVDEANAKEIRNLKDQLRLAKQSAALRGATLALKGDAGK